MAAPISRQFTFCKLSSFHRIFGGLGGVRLGGTYYFHRKDRTDKQKHKSDVNRIDENPGPWKNFTQFQKGKRLPPPRPSNTTQVNEEILNSMKLSTETENDMPVDLPDPFIQPPKRCLLCQHDVKISYKNPQLLSQFVSPYTGRLYGRQVTGLCLHMQRRVAREVRTARFLGFMPTNYKTPKYMKDPLLFNPFSKKMNNPE
ncbi:28S ribosomal protein S18c [Mactra antiquata]